MSLLPRICAINDPIPGLGRKVEPPKPEPRQDPYKQFETLKHEAPPAKPRNLAERIEATNPLLRSPPMKEAPAKFKVGDRVRSIRNGTDVAAKFVAGEVGTIKYYDSERNMSVLFDGQDLMWALESTHIEHLPELATKPDAEGWIEWKGGECPVKRGQRGQIRLRSGREASGDISYCFWLQGGNAADILAYRLL